MDVCVQLMFQYIFDYHHLMKLKVFILQRVGPPIVTLREENNFSIHRTLIQRQILFSTMLIQFELL